VKAFIVYDTQTGAILRTGSCQDETFAMQAMNAGEGVIEGEGSAQTQRVDPATHELVSIQ
jgi:hypothetical protein